MHTEEVTKCNLCNSNSLKFCFEGRDLALNREEQYPLVECANCGLIFLGKRVSRNSLNEIYVPGKYPIYDAELKKKKNVNLFIKKMYYLFVRIFIGKDFWGLKKLGKGRLLDIGCSNGAYLFRKKEEGWETYGVEISEYAAKKAKENGLNVFCGELKEAKFQNNFFDVITMNQVIEHVYEPAQTMAEINRILKPKGILQIGTIDFNSLESKLFGKYWSRLEIPRHVYFFNPKSIKKLLEGFTITDISYDYNPAGLLSSINNLFGQKLSKITNNQIIFLLFFICYSSFGRLFRLPAGRINIKAIKNKD